MQGRSNYPCIPVDMFLHPWRTESSVRNVTEPIYTEVLRYFWNSVRYVTVPCHFVVLYFLSAFSYSDIANIMLVLADENP
jgi:hypothetical protein